MSIIPLVQSPQKLLTRLCALCQFPYKLLTLLSASSDRPIPYKLFTLLCALCCAGKEGKQMGVPMDPPAFVSSVKDLLAQVQDALLAAAAAYRDENIVDVSSYEELKAAVAEGEPHARAAG